METITAWEFFLALLQCFKLLAPYLAIMFGGSWLFMWWLNDFKHF